MTCKSQFFPFTSVIVPVMLIGVSSGANADDLPIPQPPPYQPVVTAPQEPSGSGVWTFGSGVSASVTVDYPALDPRIGRIEEVILGAGTDYANPNVIVQSTLGPNPGTIAIAHDTIVGNAGGLTVANTNDVTFYCASSPCVSSQHYTSGFNFTNATAYKTVQLPYNNSATAFVASNAAIYGAKSAVLNSTTTITNINGSVPQYSITGNYSVDYSRVYVPWTTDDVVHNSLNVPNMSFGSLTINPQPALGFTAQQAANLSQFSNFNYLQTVTSAGTFSKVGSQLTTIQSGPVFPGAPLSIGNFDPLPNGNTSTQPADQFPLYWDQVRLSGDPNGTYFVTNPANNYGLSFSDSPNLLEAGRYITFQTELVGVNAVTDASGTTLSYSPLSLTTTGEIDPTLTFDWAWYQTVSNCPSGLEDCGVATFRNITDPNSSPLGVAFLLGYGDMTEAEIQAELQQDFSSFVPPERDTSSKHLDNDAAVPRWPWFHGISPTQVRCRMNEIKSLNSIEAILALLIASGDTQNSSQRIAASIEPWAALLNHPMSARGPFRQILRRKQMSAFGVTADMPRKAKIRRS